MMSGRLVSTPKKMSQHSQMASQMASYVPFSLPTPQPSSPDDSPEKSSVLFSSSTPIIDLVSPGSPRATMKSSQISQRLTYVPPLPWQPSQELPPAQTQDSEIQLTQLSVPLSMQKWSQISVPLTCEPLSQNSVGDAAVPPTSEPLPWQTSQDNQPPSESLPQPIQKTKPKPRRQRKRKIAPTELRPEQPIQVQMPAFTMPDMTAFLAAQQEAAKQGLLTQQPFMMFPFGGFCANFAQNFNCQTSQDQMPAWGQIQPTKRPKAQHELCCDPFKEWAARKERKGRPPHESTCKNRGK